MRVEFQMVFNNYGQVAEEAHLRLSQAVQTSAAAIEARSKLAIQNPPKSGIIYTKPGGQTHQASAPGEAPATDTGTLVNSISTERVSDLTSLVNVTAEYGSILEFGGVNVQPRPFLGPSVDDESEHFMTMCREAITG